MKAEVGLLGRAGYSLSGHLGLKFAREVVKKGSTDRVSILKVKSKDVLDIQDLTEKTLESLTKIVKVRITNYPEIINDGKTRGDFTGLWRLND